LCIPAEVQHGISRGVFANSAHAHRVCGVSVQQHGNPAVAGRHGRAQERRAIRPVLASYAYRRATRLPTGSGQAAAQGVVRRRDGVRPAGRLLVPDIVPRVYTEVTYNIYDWPRIRHWQCALTKHVFVVHYFDRTSVE